jgi:hypothetical protein
MGAVRNAYKRFWKTGREHSEDLGVDGKIILEWILGILGGKLCPGFIWPRIVTSASCEHDNENSVSMKGEEFLD